MTHEGASASPKVVSDSWGELGIEGVGPLRDAKLWPGGAREWDWNETGTQHDPGIQPADVDELLAHDPEVIVLSRGRELRLQTQLQTLAVASPHSCTAPAEGFGLLSGASVPSAHDDEAYPGPRVRMGPCR